MWCITVMDINRIMWSVVIVAHPSVWLLARPESGLVIVWSCEIPARQRRHFMPTAALFPPTHLLDGTPIMEDDASHDDHRHYG